MGNIRLQWKTASDNVGNWNGGDHDPHTVDFPVAFSGQPYWVGASIQNGRDTRGGYWYGFLYDGNSSASKHPGIAISKSYCVVAVQKDATSIHVMAIGPA